MKCIFVTVSNLLLKNKVLNEKIDDQARKR